MILNTAKQEICFQQLKSNGKLYLSAAKVKEITDDLLEDYKAIKNDPKNAKYLGSKRKKVTMWIYDNNYDEFDSDENDNSIDKNNKKYFK